MIFFRGCGINNPYYLIKKIINSLHLFISSVSGSDVSGSLIRRVRAFPPERDVFHAAACGAREWLSLALKRARKPLPTDKHVRALYTHTMHCY